MYGLLYYTLKLPDCYCCYSVRLFVSSYVAFKWLKSCKHASGIEMCTFLYVQEKNITTFNLRCNACVLFFNLDGNKIYQRETFEKNWSHHHVLYPQPTYTSLSRSCPKEGQKANIKVSVVQRVAQKYVVMTFINEIYRAIKIYRA